MTKGRLKKMLAECSTKGQTPGPPPWLNGVFSLKTGSFFKPKNQIKII